MINPVKIEITDEDRKDILIAWAYRYLKERGGKGSQEDEFFYAAERLVPDVQLLSKSVHYHADIAAKVTA